MTDVTRILNAIDKGDPHAAERLLPLVYDELRSWRRQRWRRKPGQTLQATALVHEAYLRLVKKDQNHQFSSRRHFFAAAAEAMRRILIDRADKRVRKSAAETVFALNLIRISWQRNRTPLTCWPWMRR